MIANQNKRASGLETLQTNHRALQAGILLTIVLAMALGAAFGSDIPVVLAGCGTIFLIFVVMWTGDGPSLFLLPCIYQWSEVAVKPILSIVTSTPLANLAEYGNDLRPAAFFGFSGVCALTIGLRLGLAGRSLHRLSDLRSFVASAMPRSIIGFSLATIVVGKLAEVLIPFLGAGFTQLLLALAGAKYIGIFLLVFWSICMRRGYVWPALVVGSEVVIGMTGFFADFRGTILVAALAVVCARPKPSLEGVVLGAVAAFGVLMIATFWSAYKPEYRDWANGGSGAQEVTRPIDERLQYLANFASRYDGEEFNKGLTALFRRHSYIDYLAATLEHVPASVPHEEGRRIGSSVIHVLTPRLLFPDKSPLQNDTDVTAYYTGLQIASGETSISLGYLGELYIDFGIWGALVAALLLGFASGLICQPTLLVRNAATPVGYPTTLLVAVSIMVFGSALIKMVGAAVTAAIIAFLFQRFLAGPMLRLFTYVGGKARRATPRGRDAPTSHL